MGRKIQCRNVEYTIRRTPTEKRSEKKERNLGTMRCKHILLLLLIIIIIINSLLPITLFVVGSKLNKIKLDKTLTKLRLRYFNGYNIME